MRRQSRICRHQGEPRHPAPAQPRQQPAHQQRENGDAQRRRQREQRRVILPTTLSGIRRSSSQRKRSSRRQRRRRHRRRGRRRTQWRRRLWSALVLGQHCCDCGAGDGGGRSRNGRILSECARALPLRCQQPRMRRRRNRLARFALPRGRGCEPRGCGQRATLIGAVRQRADGAIAFGREEGCERHQRGAQAPGRLPVLRMVCADAEADLRVDLKAPVRLRPGVSDGAQAQPGARTVRKLKVGGLKGYSGGNTMRPW